MSGGHEQKTPSWCWSCLSSSVPNAYGLIADVIEGLFEWTVCGLSNDGYFKRARFSCFCQYSEKNEANAAGVAESMHRGDVELGSRGVSHRAAKPGHCHSVRRPWGQPKLRAGSENGGDAGEIERRQFGENATEKSVEVAEAWLDGENGNGGDTKQPLHVSHYRGKSAYCRPEEPLYEYYDTTALFASAMHTPLPPEYQLNGLMRWFKM